ncbi:phage shock protein PspC (stress-responsive transcriptional regulator) [Paenibacillus anaericanus]|uniref:hypothetical protein n=1 Tax=Paenibacillus anaericanus TaxID=170367 RepID=UPI0027884E73|nr:hypothetical protein [Paenibacillus anaericanus]MDQ0091160.1 phage shock protein PspC (stress-responsive transcriptional regulator) [Paenibacillus anaericanus]
MNRFSLVAIISITGGLIGLVIGRSLDLGVLSFIITPLLCGVFGALFGGIGSYLNNKGYLVNIFQVIDLLVGFILFYFLFYAIISVITSDELKYQSYINGIAPIPCALFMIIRHIRNKEIKLRKKYEQEDGTIQDHI